MIKVGQNAANKKDELDARAKDLEQRLLKVIDVLNHETQEEKDFIEIEIMVKILNSKRSELKLLSESLESLSKQMPEKMYSNFETLFEILENSVLSSVEFLEKIKPSEFGLDFNVWVFTRCIHSLYDTVELFQHKIVAKNEMK